MIQRPSSRPSSHRHRRAVFLPSVPSVGHLGRQRASTASRSAHTVEVALVMTALKCARLFIITAIVVLKPLCVSAALSGAPFTPTASLPSLFVLQNGTNVITPAQWAARRVELRTLVQEHILGRSTHALLHDQHCTTHTCPMHCTAPDWVVNQGRPAHPRAVLRTAPLLTNVRAVFTSLVYCRPLGLQATTRAPTRSLAHSLNALTQARFLLRTRRRR
jgi:hypothetical protein